MDAALYPPSAAFEQPEIIPTQMTTADSSFAEFFDNPEALAIMKAEIPAFEAFVSNPQLKPHLGNMSPRSMAQFGAFKVAALDRVDARLKAAHIMSGNVK